MDFKKLISALDVLETRSGPAKPVTGLAYHSELVSPGDLFVCIRGYVTDGHCYLDQAVQEGAVAAVVEYFIDDIKIPQYRVSDSRQALASLADHFYEHPSHKIKIAGITATNGKTTTTYMANAILEEYGLNTGLIGTVIIKTGEQVRPAELTTPESLDLQSYLSQMVKHGVTHAVMEVSSSGLDLKRVNNVNFDIVVINNISREHIDLHGSYEDYFNAKASLVRNADEHQWAVFNLDCPNTAPLVTETKARVLTYGFKNETADFMVRNLDLKTGRASFTVELTNKLLETSFNQQYPAFTVALSVLGLHSVYNAMAAILTAILFGVPHQVIQRALKEFRGVERRFELIFEDDIKIIDDHFANSGNIHVTLETLQMMKYNNLHLVYAIRGNRGVTVNRENAEALAFWAPQLGLETIIATTSSSHVSKKDRVSKAELQVYKEVIKEAGLKTEIFEELPAAIARGLKNTAPGDVLLLAGCQGMDYGAAVCLKQIHRLKPHLDKALVFTALKNRVAGID